MLQILSENRLNSRLTFIRIIPIAVGAFILMFCGCEQKEIKKPDPDKGITRDMLPESMQWFYKMKNLEDSTYAPKFYSQYNKYYKEGFTDSALFILLAYNEVLDQNYLIDTPILNLSKKHLQERYNTEDNQHELVKLYYYIGSQYFSMNLLDSAMYWYNKGLAEPDMLSKTAVMCRSMMSMTWDCKDVYDSSIIYRLKNLEYYHAKKDTVNLAVNYLNVAESFDELGARKLALENLEKGIHYAKLRNDTFTLFMALKVKSNISINYEIDTPNFVEIAPAMNRLYENYSDKSFLLTDIWAEINLQDLTIRKKYDSMPYYLDQLKSLVDKGMDDMEEHYNDYLNYYLYFTGKEMLVDDAYKAKAHAQLKSKNLNLARDSYQHLKRDAVKKKQMAEALAYADTLNKIKNDINIQNSKGQLYELEYIYKTQLKDQEIKIQQDTIEAKQRNIFLLVAALVILILAFIITLLIQRQRQLNLKRSQEEIYLQKLMENTEDERKRIARDLHDSVGHELLSVKNAITNKLQFTEEKIDFILSEIREISRNLFPAMFEEVGLVLSIQQLVDSTYQSSGLYIICELNYRDRTLDSKSELNIYRIIQEALSNTLKYAEAKSAKISISQENENIHVEYRDNGKGFNVMETLRSNRAFGLISIEQRCKSLQAKLSIESDNSGTFIQFTIPIKHVQNNRS